MDHDYTILDVFTADRFAGNPLAVVSDADGFPTELCQRIAAEFNLSETVFVSKAVNPAHSAAVRIFTPETELPFAGHPTVGTAICLGKDRWPGEAAQDGLIVLEMKLGNVRIGVSLNGKRGDFAEFDIPKLPETIEGPDFDVEIVARALGLQPKEIGFENHRPSRFTAGVPYALVPVRDMSVLRAVELDLQIFGKAFKETGHAYVYCRETLGHKSAFHARMFAPSMGVMEDPATGSAAAAFAGQIMKYDQPTAGLHRYVIEQGHIMGRPSLIELELDVEGRNLRTVRIGGNAVIVARGTISV